MSGVGPRNVHVIELHDRFSTNELITYEGLGRCKEGEGEKLAQCAEFVWQVRGKG
jgi:hypothetical protein